MSRPPSRHRPPRRRLTSAPHQARGLPTTNCRPWRCCRRASSGPWASTTVAAPTGCMRCAYRACRELLCGLELAQRRERTP